MSDFPALRKIAHLRHSHPPVARLRHRAHLTWREALHLGNIVVHEMFRTHALDVAGDVAFWLLMSSVPLLMTAVSLLSVLHLPGFGPHLLEMIALAVPPNAYPLVDRLFASVLSPHGGILSFAVISYLWSSTSGFVSLIAALNVAYDVCRERSWMRDRLQALLMTFTSGAFLLISLLAVVLGPEFSRFLDQFVSLPSVVVSLWNLIRYACVFGCYLIGLELIYFLGPNMRQRFASTLPGALFATPIWFAFSIGIAWYMDHFARYSKMYGGLGAIFAVMFWIYLTSLAVLAGAELNAELAKSRNRIFRGHLRPLAAKRLHVKPEKSLRVRRRPAA